MLICLEYLSFWKQIKINIKELSGSQRAVNLEFTICQMDSTGVMYFLFTIFGSEL